MAAALHAVRMSQRDLAQNLSPAPRASIALVCVHCGNEVPSRCNGSVFCCAGCEAVFGILHERGWGKFYELQSKGRSLRRRSPVEKASESFSYLDEKEFLALYARGNPEQPTMNFYLEGTHCAACVWLTERIGEYVEGVQASQLNLGDSVARVTIREDGSFSAVAREFARLGYRPHPVRADEAEALSRRDDRWLLARTGVAGACAGNIMLLAVSLYAGSNGHLGETFRWASFALSLPVLLFSAQPFYRGAWFAIKGRRASIDLPIALGIALGAVSSVYNLIAGSAYLYFDSLSALVFLMLATRYFLIRTQRAATHSSRLIRFLTPAYARVRDARTGGFRDVSVDEIKAGDEIEVFSSEGIPVDGVIVQGRTAIDLSLLTGESVPKPALPDDPVFAGTFNCDAPIRIRATASGSATRLGQTLKAVEEDLAKKAPIVSFADRVARAFVVAILIAVSVVFVVGLRQGLDHAVNLALALSIVTCPCAFALATPLAMSLSIGRCAREGVLIKSADAIERLSQVREVCFDKTGTITFGKYEVDGWDDGIRLETDLELLRAILALESRSRHPIASALIERFKSIAGKLPEVVEFKEVLGVGVRGTVDRAHFEIRAEKGPESQTIVGVWRDGLLLGRIRFRDRLRPESASALARLRNAAYRVRVLTGDSVSVMARVASDLGLPRLRWCAEQSPEDKRRQVLSRERVLMVGEGANDASALAAAFVSLAVHGGVEVSLRSSDIYSRRPGIGSVAPLLVIARETMRVIRRNFAFSLIYNTIGIVGVLYGWVTPLFAAILMPLSATTVLFSSLAGTGKLRAAVKELG